MDKCQLTADVSVALNTIAIAHAKPVVALEIHIETPKNQFHGDFSCNIALQLAKSWQMAPRQIAKLLAQAISSPDIQKIEVAGAGFLNFYLCTAQQFAVLHQVRQLATAYGRNSQHAGKRALIEFVSANPTGPLHVGHGRGAAYGATLANVMTAAGYCVAREYYVNDAGRQMDILTLSAWLRYLQLYDSKQQIAAGLYQGAYVADVALQLRQQYGDGLVRPTPLTAEKIDDSAIDAAIVALKRDIGAEYQPVSAMVAAANLQLIRADLAAFGVDFQHWFHESSLVQTDADQVAAVIARLDGLDLVYEHYGAQWLRSSQFGDDKDRVLKRSNGSYTYFAVDIAYHVNKFDRNYDEIINVFGADHHGYIARLRAAIQALGLNVAAFEVVVVQFANLIKDGKKVSMSTRRGEFVSLQELITQTSCAAARFFYLLRRSDQHLDFDLDLAVSQSNDNPLYYVQYAHARAAQLLAKASAADMANIATSSQPLTDTYSTAVLRNIQRFSQVIEKSASAREPHRIPLYLRDLAASFHGWYANIPVLHEADEQLRVSRLLLCVACKQVIANGLELLNITASDKM